MEEYTCLLLARSSLYSEDVTAISRLWRRWNQYQYWLTGHDPRLNSIRALVLFSDRESLSLFSSNSLYRESGVY
jgi:hypothetical protein